MKYRGISIIKNKSCNTWTARPTINGKQKYISGKTQNECRNKLKLALSNEQPSIESNKGITLLEWYNKWLTLYKSKVKNTTKRDYKNLMNNLKTIHNKEISKLKLQEIIEILNNISAERQRQKVYDFLKMILNKAVDNEITDKNIMLKIDKPEHKKETGKALTKAQEKILIENCSKIKYGDFYLIMLYQGLRKGECLALTSEDIDFNNNTLRINKSLNENNELDTTKNIFSNRTIPLFTKTKQILEKYKNTKGRLFNISYTKINEYTKRLKNLTKINFSTKYMRFTFITRCQELNIPEFIIQSWCGHQIGSKVTKQVYTKYNPEDNTKYINILNTEKFD